jgi:hypothetical protein
MAFYGFDYLMKASALVFPVSATKIQFFFITLSFYERKMFVIRNDKGEYGIMSYSPLSIYHEGNDNFIYIRVDHQLQDSLRPRYQ